MSESCNNLCFQEDFSLKLGDSIETITFHHSLNVFIVTTKNNQIRVFDSNSAAKLTEVSFSEAEKRGDQPVACYHGGSSSVLVVGGNGSVGQRRAHHGVLLLHSVLQLPVTSPEEVVTLDLLQAEAVLLQKALDNLSPNGLNCNVSVSENVSTVKEALHAALAAHALSSSSSALHGSVGQAARNTNTAIHRVKKWQCVTLRLPVSTLRSVLTHTAAELRAGTFSQSLALAAALTHRLGSLYCPNVSSSQSYAANSLAALGVASATQMLQNPSQGGSGALSSLDSHQIDPLDREPMYSEAARLATFNKWPHMNYKWALPAQMAEAGFFHQPVMAGDDRAMCFICAVCLVFWEPTDEPWSEHERHSSNCPFVKGEYTHNVPLSYTLSTSPAVLHHSSSAATGDRKRGEPGSTASSSKPLTAIVYSNGNSATNVSAEKGDNSKGCVGRAARTTPSSINGLDADRRNPRTVAYENILQCIENSVSATNQSDRNSTNNYSKSEPVTSCERSKSVLVCNTKHTTSNYSASDGSAHGSGLRNIDGDRERPTNSRVQRGNGNSEDDTTGMLISSGNCADYMATASKRGGSVVVWKMTGVLQKANSFCIDPSESTILDKHFLDNLCYLISQLPRTSSNTALSSSHSPQFSPQPPLKHVWMDHSFDSPQSPQSPHSLHSPPDNWDDNEALTPTNLSPTQTPIHSPSHYLGHSPVPTPTVTPSLTVSQSPTQQSPSAVLVTTENSSLDSVPVNAPVQLAAEDRCCDVTGSSDRAKQQEDQQILSDDSGGGDTAGESASLDVNSEGEQIGAPTTISVKSPPSLVTLATTTGSSVSDFNTSQSVEDSVRPTTVHCHPPDYLSSSEGRAGSNSPSDDVRMWGISMLSDPAEVNYYRRGGHPADLNSLVVGGKEGIIGRPVLVAAVGLRHDGALVGEQHGEAVDTNAPAVAVDIDAAGSKPSEGSAIRRSKLLGDVVSSLEDDVQSQQPASAGTGGVVGGGVTGNRFVPYLIVYDVKLDTQVTTSFNNKTDVKVDNGGIKKKLGNLNCDEKMDSSGSHKEMWPGQLVFDELSKLNKMKSASVKKWTNSSLLTTKSKMKDGGDNNDGKSGDKAVPAPTCVQCIPLPDKLNSIKLGLRITRAQPTACGKFLMVCLSRPMDASRPDGSSVSSDAQAPIPCGSPWATLLVYGINGGGATVRLSKEPLFVKHYTEPGLVTTNIIALPSNAYDNECSSSCCRCAFACITDDGALRVLSVSSLQQLYHLPPRDNNRFHTLTYCHILGLERVCLCQRDGSMLLVNLNRPGDSDSSDEADTALLAPVPPPRGSALCSTNAGYPRKGEDGVSAKRPAQTDNEPLLAEQPLTEWSLRQCLQLTVFQPGCPNLVATVPPCWLEMTQAQQQRRNPQHLQQQHLLHAPSEVTRCWSLDTDNSSWDEHLFELMITPSAASSSSPTSSAITVGHINIKLQLARNRHSLDPNIQVTLLRQVQPVGRAGGGSSKHRGGIDDSGVGNSRTGKGPGVIKGSKGGAKRASSGDGVDSATATLDAAMAAIMDEAAMLDQMLDFPVNPCTTKAFQGAHNAEMVCGPVSVGQCLDLSGHTACVTFSSPALATHRGRCTFLVHIKAMPPVHTMAQDAASMCGAPDIVSGYCPPEGGSSMDRLVSSMDRNNSSAAADSLKGCNVVQELSITLNTATCSQTDKRQRSGILSRCSFHDELVRVAVAANSSVQLRTSALDLLLWLLVLLTPPSHGRDGSPAAEYTTLVASLQRHLPQLVRRCLLLADRTIARKTTKIIVAVIQHEKERPSSDPFGLGLLKDESPSFSSSACEAVLESVSAVAACQSAGALAHYFMLLNYVKWEDQDQAAAKMTELLKQTDAALEGKVEPLHTLLQTRFGLHGAPLHRTLFNVLPPCFIDFKAKDNSESVSGSDINNPSAPAASLNTVTANKNIKPGLLTSIFVSDIDTILFGGNSSNSTGGGKSSSQNGLNNNPGGTASSNNSYHHHHSVGTPGGNGGGGSSGNGWSSLCPPLPGLCGLLEVEPLHATLHTASDGTKLQRASTGWSSINSAVGGGETLHAATLQDLGHSQSDTDALEYMFTLAEQTAEHLANNVDDMMDIVLNIELNKAPDVKKAFNNVKLTELMSSSDESSGGDLELADLDKLIGKTSEQIAKLQELVNQGSKLHALHDHGSSQLHDLHDSAAHLVSFKSIPKGGFPCLGDSPAAGNCVSQNISAVMPKEAATITTTSQNNITDSSLSLLSNPITLPDVVSSSSLSSNSSNSSYKSCETDLKEVVATDDLNVVTSVDKSIKDAESPRKQRDSTSSQGGGDSIASGIASKNTPLMADDDKSKEGSRLSPGPVTSDPSTLAASSWQQFLSLPPQQHLVVERMYSGARRFVVLDFGEPILLTDVVVPTCADLVSLSVDVWLTGEERDALRIVVCPDIGSRPLVLTDLQPPLLCRFIKLTSLGRYGMITAESNIALGNFYGHRLLLPWVPRAPQLSDQHAKIKTASKQHAQSQLVIASSVAEAVDCRYTLASNKLRSLLQLHAHHTKGCAADHTATASPDRALGAKIRAAYQECMMEQHHLNVIVAMLSRLQRVLGLIKDGEGQEGAGANGNPAVLLQQSSCDKLQTIHQYAINSLLTLTLHPTLTAIPAHTLSPVLLSYCGSSNARGLFRSVLLRGSVAAQVCFAATLLRTCVGEPWWGDFLTGALQDMFGGREARGNGSTLQQQLPTTRIFGLLTFLGQKSVCSGEGSNVINAVLECLARLMHHSSGNASSTSSAAATSDATNRRYDALFSRLLPSRPPLDMELLEWLLLYLSHCLDAIAYVNTPDTADKNKDTGGRWSWLCAESWLSADMWYNRRNKACKERIRKRLGGHHAASKHMASSGGHHHYNKAAADSLASDAALNKAMGSLSGKIPHRMMKKIKILHYETFYKYMHKQAVRNSDAPRSFVNSVSRMAAARAGVSGGDDDGAGGWCSGTATCSAPTLSRDTALTVVRGLLALLTEYNSAHYDTFLVMCKVVGVVCTATRPCLRLTEVLSTAELLALIQHSLSLHQHKTSAPHTAQLSPWVLHSLTCLLTDIISGEKHHGVVMPEKSSTIDQSFIPSTSGMFSAGKRRNNSTSNKLASNSGRNKKQSMLINNLLDYSLLPSSSSAGEGSHLATDDINSCIIEDLENYDDYEYDMSTDLDSKDTDCLLGDLDLTGMVVDVQSGSSSDSGDTKYSDGSSKETVHDVAVTYDRLESNGHEKIGKKKPAGDEDLVCEDQSAEVGPATTVLVKGAKEATSSDDDEEEVTTTTTQPSEEVPDIAYGQLEDDSSECDKENTLPCDMETTDSLTALGVLRAAEVVASPSIHREETTPLAKANRSQVTISEATTTSRGDGDNKTATSPVVDAKTTTEGSGVVDAPPPMAVAVSGTATSSAGDTSLGSGGVAAQVVSSQVQPQPAVSSTMLQTAPAVNLATSQFAHYELEDLPGFGDSGDSSENEEMGFINDLAFISNMTPDSYLNSLDSGYHMLSNSWEVINAPELKALNGQLKGLNGLSPSSRLSSSRVKDSVPAKSSLNVPASCIKSGVFHSTATDHRLQNSVLLHPELRLAMLHATHTSTLHAAATAPLQVAVTKDGHPSAPACGPGDTAASSALLTSLFDTLLEALAAQPCNSLDIESAVNLWLSLVLELCEDSSDKVKSTLVPQLPLSPAALSALLQALLNCGANVSLKCWGAVLHLLTLSCNSSNKKVGGAVLALVDDPNLVPVFILFLTTNFSSGEDSTSGLVGSSVATGFHNLLVRLVNTCDCYSAVSESGNKLKVLLLEVVARLLHLGVGDSSSSGAPGSLDAQCILMKQLTTMHFSGLEEISLMLEIVNRTAVVVHKHVLHVSQAAKLVVSSSGSSSVGSSRNDSLGASSVSAAVAASACCLLNPFGNPSEAGSSTGVDGGGVWGGLTQGPSHSSLPRPHTGTFLYTLLTLVEQLIGTPLGPQAFNLPKETANGGRPSEEPITSASSSSSSGPSSSTASGEGSGRTGPRKRIVSSNVTCNHTISWGCSSGTNILADTVVGNRHTVSLLFRALGLCPDSYEVLQRCSSSGEGPPVTISVALYNLLSTLNRTLSRPQQLLQPMLAFVTPSAANMWAPFSPLCMTIFTAVLDCEEMLQHMVDLGGIKLLWQNLTTSVSKSCFNHSDHLGGLIGSVMNQLSPSLPSSTSMPSKGKRVDRMPYSSHLHHNPAVTVGGGVGGGSLPPITGHSPWHFQNHGGLGNKSAVMSALGASAAAGASAASSFTSAASVGAGLVNFAPLAIVSASHQGVRSPHSLVVPSQFLQRTKTPSWSHHFYGNDTFIVLTLKLPCPVLLHEIALQPHSAPSSYPSAVSVTAGLDGRCCSAITGLVATDTLSYVKLTLRSPVIASMVNIRLYKPKEFSTLCLSQIRLMGTTAFKGLTSLTDSVVPTFVGDDALRTQQDYNNCDWWLLLLRHSMTLLPVGRDAVLLTGVQTNGVVSACTNLLLAPQYAGCASNSAANGTAAVSSAGTPQSEWNNVSSAKLGVSSNTRTTNSLSESTLNVTTASKTVKGAHSSLKMASASNGVVVGRSEDNDASDNGMLKLNTAEESISYKDAGALFGKDTAGQGNGEASLEDNKENTTNDLHNTSIDHNSEGVNQANSGASASLTDTSSVPYGPSVNGDINEPCINSTPTAECPGSSADSSHMPPSSGSKDSFCTSLNHYSGTSPLEQIILGLAQHSSQWLEEFVAEMLCHPRLAEQSVSQRRCGLRLLYSVCVNGSSVGSSVLLHWLLRLLSHLPSTPPATSDTNPCPTPAPKLLASPSLLHVAASIIWNTKHHLQQDTNPLLKSVVFAACACSLDSELKQALDAILCALCYSQPQHFSSLSAVLIDTGFGNLDPNTADVPTALVSGLSAGQLETVVEAARSSTAIEALLGSRLPVQIVCTVLEFCQRLVCTELKRCKKQISNSVGSSSDNSPSDSSSTTTTTTFSQPACPQQDYLSSSSTHPTRPDDSSMDNEAETGGSSRPSGVTVSSEEVEAVARLVRLLSRLCEQPAVQDWMGQGHGALLWNTLLTVLGDSSVNNLTINLGSLECATIELLRKACLNHPVNHRRISGHLCNLIKRQKNIAAGGLRYVHSLSGFTRSLVVQVLLECERMLVEVEVGAGVAVVEETPVQWLHADSPAHPRHGLPLNSRLLNLPLDTTVADVIAELTGSSEASGGALSRDLVPPSWPRQLPLLGNKDEPMVICFEDDDDDDDDEDDIANQMAAAEQAAFNHLSMAAGLTAKDKRNKDIVNAIVNGVISGVKAHIDVVACKVCGDKATGLHYGLVTCDPCKGFFRRTFSSGKAYQCLRQKKCVVDRANRNRCLYCRMQKCIQLGMSLDEPSTLPIPKKVVPFVKQTMSSNGGKNIDVTASSSSADEAVAGVSGNNNSNDNTDTSKPIGSNLSDAPFSCTVVVTRIIRNNARRRTSSLALEEESDDGSEGSIDTPSVREVLVEYEVPLSCSVAQILAGLMQFTTIQNTHLKLRVNSTSHGVASAEAGRTRYSTNSSSNRSAAGGLPSLPSAPSVSLLLEEFSSQGGLSLLAQHMTILYPDLSVQPSALQQAAQLSKPSSGPNTPLTNSINNAAHITGNSSLLASSLTGNVSLSSVAPHTLGAFTLFLRLPGYAEALLQDPVEAKALLRMALGVQDADRSSLRPDTVATVVYTRLNHVLLQHPVQSSEGASVRQCCLECGVVHHLLACLAALSAHTPPSLHATLRHKHVPVSSVIAGVRAWCMDHYGGPASAGGAGGRSEGGGGGSLTGGGGGTGVSTGGADATGDRCHYWAKGTGFGTGSTMQSWDVEQAIVRQRVQEEHIVWLLRLLHNIINPGDTVPNATTMADGSSASSPRGSSRNNAAAKLSQHYTNTTNLSADNSRLNNSSTDSAKSTTIEQRIGQITSSDNDNISRNINSVSNSDIVDSVSDGDDCDIRPKESIDEENDSNSTMKELLTLLRNSQFMDKVASHLSNDSVLDLSRHVPLYRALLALVRSMAVTEVLSPLLLHRPSQQVSGGGGFSLLQLLSKMTSTVNTYITKLAWKPSKQAAPSVSGADSDAASKAASNKLNNNVEDGGGSKHMVKTLMYMDDAYESTMKGSSKSSIDDLGLATDDTDDEGLTLLVPDLQRTEQLVKAALERLYPAEQSGAVDPEDSAQDVSVVHHSVPLTQIYLDTLKPLQFDSFEMVVEDAATGSVRFTVTHLFEGSLRNMSTCVAPRRIKRLAQEAVTLSSSLPLSYSSSVFLRTDTDRLDIMKVLIVGPEDTPYANGLFEFDIYFPVDYPTSPLQIKLQTTGEGRVRFNPNLYQDGKVCLSILNTWHGRPEEKWNSQTSSLLQVLVSIQSLILVSEPYFNEPGYERSRGTASATQHSREYDANIRAATVKWAILHQLKEPSPCFKEVSAKHFYLKQHEILSQVDDWIEEMEDFPESNRRASRGLPHNIATLKKLLVQLKEEFSKLKPPAGLEGVHQLSSPSPPAPQPPSDGAPSPSQPSASLSCPSRPRERKTSKANLISDLKWCVIDEETEEGEGGTDVGQDATAASQKQLPPAASAVALTNLAAAVNSTADLFSTAAAAVSNSTSDQDSAFDLDINMDTPPYISLDSFIDDPL